MTIVFDYPYSLFLEFEYVVYYAKLALNGYAINRNCESSNEN